MATAFEVDASCQDKLSLFVASQRGYCPFAKSSCLGIELSLTIEQARKLSTDLREAAEHASMARVLAACAPIDIDDATSDMGKLPLFA
ncbi:hypothetical protein [Chelatococcus asaccharovorans]|uniref:hypothetical protein n=1 Tax=Chelatococcus asaccharovorans TaxID=28210 RepID=UPI0011B6A286|nr:hypothetical protein [Chelatococcus asaccharovorans]MBS7703188.1 hypothetical protein [Chelatococcus asaccharovorans]